MCNIAIAKMCSTVLSINYKVYKREVNSWRRGSHVRQVWLIHIGQGDNNNTVAVRHWFSLRQFAALGINSGPLSFGQNRLTEDGKKGKAVRIHAAKVYRGEWRYILNPGTRWK
jgi:hypothetical protein